MEAAHSSLLFPFSFTSVIANDREKDDGVREETKLNDQQQKPQGRGNHQRAEKEARHRDSHNDDDDVNPDFSLSSPLSLLPLPSREEWDRLAQTRLCIRVREENTKITRRRRREGRREMKGNEEEDEEKEGREIGKSNLKDTTTRGAEEREESHHHHRHRQQSNHQFHDYFLSVKDVKVVCHLLGIKPKVAAEVSISLVRELLKRTASGRSVQSNVEEEREGADKKEDGEEQDEREEITTTEEELFSSPTSPSSANIVNIPYHLFAVVAFEVLSVNSRAPFDLQSLQPYWDEENKEDGNDREIFNDENNGQHTKSRRNGPPLPFPQSHPHPYPSSSPFFTSTPPATPSSPQSTAAASPPALPSSPFKLGTALHPPQPSPQSQPQSPPPPQPLHHPAAQQQQQQTSTSSASFATFFRLLHTLLAIVTHRSALIVLCGGTSGTGKTTLASLLAARFGIRRIVSTDSLREALRFVVRRRGEDEDVGGEEVEKDDKEPDGEKRDNSGDTKEKEEDLRSNHDKDAGAEMKRDGDEKRDDKLVAAVGQHQLRFGELFVSTYEAYKCDASQACLAKITAATTKTNTNARTKTRSTVTTLTTTQGVAMEKGKRKNEGKRDDGEEERGFSLPSHPSPCAIGGDATAPTATAKGNTNDNSEDNGNDIVSSSVLGHHIQASLVMPSVLAFIRRALLSPASSSSPTPRHRRGVKANRNKKRNGSSIRVGGDGDDDHLRTTMNTAAEYDDDDDDDEGNNHRSSSKSCSCSCSSSALFESRSAIIEGIHLTVEAVQQIAYEVNVRPYLKKKKKKKKKKKIVVRGDDNGRREREREIGNRMGEEKEKEEETNLSASNTTTKEGTDEGGNASSSSPLPRPPRVIVVPTLIHIEKEEAHKQRFAARSSSSSLTNTVKKDNNDKDKGDSSSTRPNTTCLDTANDAVAADKENEEDAERKDRSGDGGREDDGGGKVVNDACPAGVSPTTSSSLFDPTNEPDAVVTTMMRSIDVSNNCNSSSSSISVSQKQKKADDRITNINTMMMKPTTMKNRKGREGEEDAPTEEVETPASATSELAITTARETAVPVVVAAAAVVGLSLSPTHNKYVAQLPSIRAIQEHGLVKPSIAFQEAFLLKVMLMQQRHGTQKEDEDEGKTHANTSPTSSDDVIGDCSGSFFPILRVLNTNVDRSLMRIHCHMLKVVEIVGIFKQHQRDHDEEEKSTSSSSPSSSPVCLFSSVVAKLTRDCLADVYKKRRKEAREKKEEREEDREDGNEVFVRKRVKIKQEERRGKKSYEKKKSVTFSSSVFAFAPPAALTSSVAGDLVIDNGGAKNVIIKKKDKEEEEAGEEGFATTTTTDACSVDEDEEDDHGEGGAYSSGIDRPPLSTVCTSSNAISSRLHPSTRHRFINDATTTATSAFMLDTTATTAPVRGYDSYNNSKKESNKEVAASSSSSSANNSSEEEEEERGEGRGATEDVGWFNQHNLREGENEGSGEEEEEEEQRGRGRRTRLDTAFFSPSLSAKDTLSLIHTKHAAKKRRWGRKQK